MSNDAAHKKFIGVKVLNSSKKCTQVKVEVGEKNNTPVEYRYSFLVLKYSSEVVLLRYYTALVCTIERVKYVNSEISIDTKFT